MLLLRHPGAARDRLAPLPSAVLRRNSQGECDMRTASSGSLLLVVLLMVIWLMASNVFAQEDAAKAIVGVWEGTSTSGSTTGQTRLVFSQDGDKLKWKWSWTASFGNGEAEGTVTKIALPCLELNGAYTSHP